MDLFCQIFPRKSEVKTDDFAHCRCEKSFRHLMLQLILPLRNIKVMYFFFFLYSLYSSRAAANFQFTNCKPYGFQRKGLEEQCSCGKGCTSAFPCIKVLITFTEYSSLVTHNISENIILHETETTLYREVRFT